MSNQPHTLLQVFKDLLRQEKFGSQSEIVTELQKLGFHSIESLPNAHQSRGGTHA